VVLGSIVLCGCTGRCVLLGEVGVKSCHERARASPGGLRAGVEASGILLDFFPAGPVLHIDGVKTLIS
jgi:hypothetical protein